MSEELPIICYVDDQTVNLEMVEASLCSDYDVRVTAKSTKAMALFEACKPAIIILDVNMPDVDGYQLCSLVRQDPELKNTPVVFISSRNNLQDRLEAFDVGGDAYLTRPCESDELKRIIFALYHRYNHYHEVKEELGETKRMVWDLLRGNSELGIIIKCIQSLAKSRDEKEFLSIVFSAFKELSLDVTIMLRFYFGEAIARSDLKVFSLIEEELLQSARAANSKITWSGNKYIFSGENCIFLVKNMPIEDQMLLGRLVDNLSVLVDAFENSIELMNFREKEKERRAGITSSTNALIQGEIKDLLGLFEGVNGKIKFLFDQHCVDIEFLFSSLDLTENQEDRLFDCLSETRKQLESEEDLEGHIVDSINKITTSVNSITSDSKGLPL